MEKSLVTVYITTLNRPQLLQRALDSLCRQTYKFFEVIICNDFSDYEYLEIYNKIIDKYQNEFQHLIYLCNDSRKGACFSRNKAISFAKGEFITGLDDDDIFDNMRLELFVEASKNISASFICSGIKKIGNIDHKLKRKGIDGKYIKFEEMKRMNFVGNQVFIKTERLRELNGFDETLPAWQDYDMWFRVIKKLGPCFKINACTMYLDDDESRDRITTSSKSYKGYLMFVEKHKDVLNENDLLWLKYADLLNRKQKISFINKSIFKDIGLYKTILKYQMVYRFPKIYKFYQFNFK